MGLLSRIRSLFGVPSLESDDDEDAPFRCIRCGTGFDRNYRSCPECGAEFVAEVDDESAT